MKKWLKNTISSQWIDYSQAKPSFRWDYKKNTWHVDSLAGKIVHRCKTDQERARFRERYLNRFVQMSESKSSKPSDFFKLYREITKKEKRTSYYRNVRTRLRGIICVV